MKTKKDKFFKTETFSYFIRFFSVFSIIFLVMTGIILQVLNTSLFQTTDNQLRIMADDSSSMIKLALLRDIYLGDLKISDVPHLKPEKSPETSIYHNNYALLLDANGTVLNRTDDVLKMTEVDWKSIIDENDEINELQIKNYFGDTEFYRYKVIYKENISTDLDIEVSHIIVLTNITQLRKSHNENQKIIIAIMIVFWIISILVSWFLTLLTIKPIRLAYEKQKAFVENASHELRTPLTVLQNRLEGLFRKPEATIMEEFESVASSLEEVRNMTILTGNLLNLARRDGKFVVNLEEVFPDFFDTTFENYALVAEESQKMFQSKNLVRRVIQTDAALLKQVLTILFDNAMKYTEDQGQIVMTSKLRDRHLIVTVEDNGIGISDEDKKKIFDRFYRVDKARSRQNGGLGLGLSLAKQIVDGLGGQIKVYDRLPKGSIFELRLPL